MRLAAWLDESDLDIDQRVYLRVDWDTFEGLLEAKGDERVPRVTYLDGELELMSPAKTHERNDRIIELLLFVWAQEKDVLMEATGAWTLKNKGKKSGVEPDGSWVVGDRPDASHPDLVLEVVHTHGGLDKLEVYRRLGIREVWFWIDGELSVHVMRAKGYVRAARSALFPKLDLKQLAAFARQPSRARAPRLYRAALRRAAARSTR